ncbi:MAG TPA: hypothetical protein VNY73_02470 [Bacteroidia bacterium]|nr:hypothetical protein [Bacteroidia bacterium]
MKFYCTIPLSKKFLTALFFTLLVAFTLRAQTSATSSPYSRFALGRPENTGFSSIFAQGGSYTAFQNDSTAPFYVNQGNPASYSFNRLTTYEFGARYGFYKYEDSQNGIVKKQNGGFNYISLAFPIRRNMGAAFGLLPYSNVGYEVTTYETVTNIGQITNNYQGTGGINQAYGGYAIRPFERAPRHFQRSKTLDTLRKQGKYRVIKRKRFFANALSSLSLGTNVSFMYGTINYATRKYFPVSFGSVFNTKDFTETQMHDLYVQGGAQMSFDIDSIGKHNLKKNIRVTLGYSASIPKDMAVTVTHMAINFSQGSYGNELNFDTFAYQPRYKGVVHLPLMHSVGLGIKRGESFSMVFDAGIQQWSKFSFLGDNQNLKDQYRFSMGMQFLPSRNAIGSGAYFKRTMYRVGARYNTGYLFLNGTHIGEYAVSAGLGLPVGRYRLLTIVNLSVEYGRAGTLQNNLVQERFIRFVAGFTFNDKWFIKPKYD